MSNSRILEIRLYFCLLVFGFNVPSIMDYCTKEITIEEDWPWLVWLSGLSAGLFIKGLPVPFPVRAHAWVAGQVPQ